MDDPVMAQNQPLEACVTLCQRLTGGGDSEIRCTSQGLLASREAGKGGS
jgi:hypothetical protein